MAAVRACVLGTFLDRRPNATFSTIVMWGNSPYCWNTVFTSRLYGGTCDTSSPWSRIDPLVGSSKPAIIRRVVVLPQPEGPSMEKNSPALMSKCASSTAMYEPKCLVT